MIDFQLHREHQAIDRGFERTDFGGKLEREHGHCAIRKINAGATQKGFFVDRRAGLDVVADVGDVDIQGVVAVGEAVHPYGVVEITGGYAIDGDDVERAEILAAGELVGANDVREALGLFQDFRGKFMGDMMLADDDLDVHAEIVRMAQDFDDAADGVLAIFGKFDNFHVHDHAVQIFGPADMDGSDANAVWIFRSRRQFHAFRNFDPLADAIVVRDNEGSALAEAKLADYSLVGAAQDA